MADETKVTEKVYCYDHPSAYQNNDALIGAIMSANKSNDPASTMAMINGGMNGQWNNPFIYLVWMMFANRFFGNGTDATTAQNSEVLARVNELGSQMNTNQNTNLMMDAINGNHESLHALSASLGVDFAQLNGAVSAVQNAITSVGGTVGYSAEKVINAVNLGDQNITSKLCECCCNTQKAIMQQGYENQLATERQTGILGSKIDGLQSANQLGQFQMQSALGSQINDNKNAMINGFAQVGYAASQNTNAIIQAANANTQRILDTICNNNTQELRDKLVEMSQTAQTQTIINALKTTTTTTA